MFKKAITLSLLASTFLFADAGTDEKIKKLESLVNTMQKEIETLKKDKSGKEMKEELGFLGERLDDVEKQAFMNKIQFGLNFKTRMDNYENKTAAGNTYNDSNLWSSKVSFNARSEIADNMVFKGRLTAYKNWGDSTRRYTEQVDFTQGRIPSDSSIYLERAYIDWGVITGDVPLTLSIGRLPGADGTSYQFMEDTERKSNYSASLFDVALDGMILSLGLEKSTGIPSAAVRLGYGKPYQDDDTALTSSSNTGVIARDEIDDYQTYALILEGSIPSVKDSLLGINVAMGTDIVASPIETDAAKNKTVGDFMLYGGFVELPKLISELDVFMHANYSSLEPNEELYSVTSGSSSFNIGLLKGSILKQTELGASAIGAKAQAEKYQTAGKLAEAQASAVAAQNYLNQLNSAIAEAKNDTSSKTGHNFWVGTRYTLPFKAKPKIGVEYNYGSKYWWSGTTGAYHPSNKLATRGSAYEIYYLHPINSNANIRVGYIYQDNEYTQGHLGEPMKISELKNSAIAKSTGLANKYVDTMSNLYFTLNILF